MFPKHFVSFASKQILGENKRASDLRFYKINILLNCHFKGKNCVFESFNLCTHLLKTDNVVSKYKKKYKLPSSNCDNTP